MSYWNPNNLPPERQWVRRLPPKTLAEEMKKRSLLLFGAIGAGACTADEWLMLAAGQAWTHVFGVLLFGSLSGFFVFLLLIYPSDSAIRRQIKSETISSLNSTPTQIARNSTPAQMALLQYFPISTQQTIALTRADNDYDYDLAVKENRLRDAQWIRFTGRFIILKAVTYDLVVTLFEHITDNVKNIFRLG